MQYFVPADFIGQKPIRLPGMEAALLVLPSLLTTFTEPDMVVVNIFKNNVANRSKEVEEDSSKGKKHLQSEPTSAVSEVWRAKRQGKTNKSTINNPTIDKSTDTWVTAIKNLQCVLLTYCAKLHSKETQELWWNLIAPEGRWPFDIDGTVHLIFFS